MVSELPARVDAWQGAQPVAPASAPSPWDRRARGWRGPALAAAVAVAAGLPGLLALPALDRDESRFAEAAAEMLGTGDLVIPRVQGAVRARKPVGITWLQAAAVKATSSAEARDIGPYRLPSLIGAALAAASCAWGAAAFLGAGRGALAGMLLGASGLLSAEAGIAKTDAALCGAVTLMMAALGRLYAQARGGEPAGRQARALLWTGLATGLLLKGPVAPVVLAGALGLLWAQDRRAGWMRRLGWSWGLLLTAFVVGPWAAAATAETDGAFWTGIGGDVAPKLAGVRETHGGPPGLHLLLLPVLAFPATLLLPAAAVGAWRARRTPMVRFAAAWLAPGWLLFELAPTKLPHYPLPLYGAIAWACAAALPEAGRPRLRWAGAALGVAAALALGVGATALAARYGAPGLGGAVVATDAWLAAAALGGGALLILGRPATAALAAGAAGVLAHATFVAAVAPRLDALWTSHRAAALVARAGLDPRNGVTPGPVAAAGYAEPSLVFELGDRVELEPSGAEAADAVAVGEPALVEDRQDAAFKAELARDGAAAERAGRVEGFDYSNGRRVGLTLWRARPVPTEAAPGSPAP